MLVVVTLSTIVPIGESVGASVNLEESLLAILRQDEGICVKNLLIRHVTKVLRHDNIVAAVEPRRNQERWQCAVMFEAEAIALGAGECLLLTRTDVEHTASFESAHCVAVLENEAMAERYKPGFVAPLVLAHVDSISGQPNFTAVARPWTVSEMRLPFFAEGGVSEAETEGLEVLSGRLTAAMEAYTNLGTGAAAARLGVRPKGKPAAAPTPLGALVARLLAGEEWPTTRIDPAPERGGAGVSPCGPNDTLDAAVERPAVVVRHLLARDISMWEMLHELETVHADRLKPGAQDGIWTIAREARAS
jgi:hypothetical protein